MNRRNKIILGLTIAVILFFTFGAFVHKSIVSWRFSRAVSAAGAMPYQIGLTNTVQIKCTLSCCTPVCSCCIGTVPMVSTLCPLKDVATCSLYSEINGTMAGGSGRMALFSNITQIPMSGYKPGDSIIAGGMSMTQMDQGVLATPGGCAGCMTKSGINNKIFTWLEKLDKYIIAGFKDKIK